jgi:isocitrate dehydrogenase
MMSEQKQDKSLAECFAKIAKQIEQNQAKIDTELVEAQGKPVDIGGYYLPDLELVAKHMRPSQTFNKIIDSM